LEESEQLNLRNLIGHLLDTTLSAAARNKLHEALVRVMEKAFLSGWWKDPLGDLLASSSTFNFKLLALIPSLSVALEATTTTTSTTAATTSTSSYKWHHEIKSHSTHVIKAILSSGSFETDAIDCIKNWTRFGAFSFVQLEAVLQALTAKLDRILGDEVDEIEDLVDCLVEICESVTRDTVEEARKAIILIPTCLKLEKSVDPVVLTRLAAALAEECSTFLVSSCHQDPVQAFLGLLLRLTDQEGIVGVDDSSSPMTLNAWYLICEAVDCCDDESNTLKILISLLGESLAPILLKKATCPAPNLWANLQRDLQQQFLQIRREFLDTLLYIQRALRHLHSPSLLLELIHHDLLSSLTKSKIETRLRALIIISEEEEGEDGGGDGEFASSSWKKILSLVYSSPSITQDLVNAKLAISLFGSLLPLMKGESTAADETVKMLLSQFHSNPLVRDECLAALQQAVDLEVSILSEPSIIEDLLCTLETSSEPGSRTQMINLISRMICEIKNETPRWAAFNCLLRICGDASNDGSYGELSLVFKSVPFTFDSATNSSTNDYKSFLDKLHKIDASLAAKEALLAAWTGLSASKSFHLFVNNDQWSFFENLLSSREPGSFSLGMKLLTAWIYGMATVAPEACQIFLESASNSFILPFADVPEEEGLEALLDGWMHLVKNNNKKKENHHQINSMTLSHLQAWIIERIVIGGLSVPLLRSFARFLCLSIEFNLFASDLQLFKVLETIFAVGLSGKIGRSGMEILARVAYDISLQNPDFFRAALNQLIIEEVGSGASTLAINVNSADRRAFLRNLGAAHTIKKFKSVLVDFCLQTRGVLS